MGTIRSRRVAFAIATLIVVVLAVWRRHENHAVLDAQQLTEQHHGHARANESKHLASIAGTIRDDHGAPIANARVCAGATAADVPTDLTRDPLCAVSDVRGQYLIDNLFAAHYAVSAMAPQFTLETFAPDGPDRPVMFTLFATERRRGVDIVLHHGGLPITGTITDAGGGAIAHAHVRIDTTWQRYGHASIDVESDDHGHYSAWTRATSVTVVAVAEGYAPSIREGNAPAEIDLELVVESTLEGTVVDASNGDPVPDVTVYASGDSGPSSSTETDEKGHFLIDRLRPGRYTAIARTPHGTGQANGSTQVALGEHVDGIAVRLYPAHQIVAHVIADGKPCIAAMASLVDERKNLQPDVTIDPDGTLHADGVLPGTYIVSPACENYVRDDHYDPIVVEDHDVTATWTVHAGATVIGHVRTEHGSPVAFATVSAQNVESSARISSSYTSDRASAEGEYALRGLRPGRYHLFVERPYVSGTSGGLPTTKLDLEVAGTVQKDLVLPDLGGTITGTVTTSDKTSPGRVGIQARVSPDSDPTIVTSDDAGHFELHDLPPATYELVVLGGTDHGLYENLTPGGAAHVAVTLGQPAIANLVIELPSGVIRGRVVDKQGVPVTDAFVGLAFESGDAPELQHARGDSDEILVGVDGRFVAQHLSKGPYSVRASRKGGAEVVVAHVPLGSDITLAIAPTAEVIGVAHLRGTPIDDLHVTLYDRDTQERFRDESFFRTEGHFAIHDVPAGHYRVVLATGGSQVVSDLDLTEGQHATLDLELQGVVTLVGRAVDLHDHHPIAGISMMAYLSGANGTFLVPADLRNKSDADGRFEIPNVPRGELEINGSSIEDGGHLFDPISVHRSIAISDPEVIDIGTIAVVSETLGTHGNSGFSLEVSGEPHAAHVVSVEPNGAAAQAGIYVGDVITAVDGVDVTGIEADRARDLIRGDAGIAIQVTLERGDTVTLVLAP